MLTLSGECDKCGRKVECEIGTWADFRAFYENNGSGELSLVDDRWLCAGCLEELGRLMADLSKGFERVEREWWGDGKKG